MGMSGWDTVNGFIDVLKSKGRRNALYRGQSDSSWRLVPSIFRNGARGISERSILHSWKKQAAFFASPMPRDDVEWLVLAQHYGLATPLLDWTTNPLVALFFACDGAHDSNAAGCVWWTRQSEFVDPFDTLMIDPFSDGSDKPILINAVGRNVRSTAQDSYMSLHTLESCDTVPAENIFTVPPEGKRDTILTLEKIGLTSERLHSDITKLVEKFKKSLGG